MQDTPKGLRLHIGIFGRRNVGKSSLMNALSGQDVAIVSDTPGTTTDPVEKTFELSLLGPVVFVDTAGVDDEGALGELRREKTMQVLARVDVAIIVTDLSGIGEFENELMDFLAEQKTPFLIAFNKADIGAPTASALDELHDAGIETVSLSVVQNAGIDSVKHALFRLAPEPLIEEAHLVGDLLAPGDLVILVVPIDLGAPKGRLILPQVQTLRDILDSDASAMVVKERELHEALTRLNIPPRLVVCDSQVVLKAAADTPADIPLTTFSILMSRFKGEMQGLARGAAAIHHLRPGDRVLIAEACSHHALADDIGRVKIPRWLHQFAGGKLETEVVAGKDFPHDLSPYKLVVQCGGCMVTRKQVLLRQMQAEKQGIPMTNYGMAISVLQGVLERTLACFPAALASYRDHRQDSQKLSAR